MNNKDYSVEDLAADSHFIDWVKKPDAANSAFWEEWLAKHPDKVKDVAFARQLVTLWQTQPVVASPESINEVWARIQAEKAEEPERFVRRKNDFWRQPAIRWAAVFVGVLLFTTAYFWIAGNWNKTHYATRNGETKTILLPDGSTVILNANSSLTFRDWTRQAARVVELEGEAYFSVTHKADHQKFIVETDDNLRVEVLGTTFTVAKGKEKTQVVLNSGKVALYTNKTEKPLLMKPGELVEVPRSKADKLVHRRVRADVYSAWKDNRFLFDNTPLADVAAMIEHDFGYSVQFTDSTLADKRLTVHLDSHNLELLLTVLAETHDLQISRRNHKIVISKSLK